MGMGKLQEKKFEKNNFFASLKIKSMKKGVGSGSGSAPKCHGYSTLHITY
jgi:hypothetical protein